MQIPIEPTNHHRLSATARPVQVKVQGARSAPAWIAPNQPTLTQSIRLPFQVSVTACLRLGRKRPQPRLTLAKRARLDCQTCVTGRTTARMAVS